MSKDDVLFGYRLRLFAEAARTNVSAFSRALDTLTILTTALLALSLRQLGSLGHDGSFQEGPPQCHR